MGASDIDRAAALLTRIGALMAGALTVQLLVEVVVMALSFSPQWPWVVRKVASQDRSR